LIARPREAPVCHAPVPSDPGPDSTAVIDSPAFAAFATPTVVPAAFLGVILMFATVFALVPSVIVFEAVTIASAVPDSTRPAVIMEVAEVITVSKAAAFVTVIVIVVAVGFPPVVPPFTAGVTLTTSATAAPSVAGSYVVKVTPAVNGGTTGGNPTATTITITVTKAAALDTVITSATSIITAGRVESGTADAIVTASKTITDGTNANTVANIKITPKNAAGTTVGVANAANAGESMTAVLSGPGSLGTGAWQTGASLGRAINVKAGDFVYVYPDEHLAYQQSQSHQHSA